MKSIKLFESNSNSAVRSDKTIISPIPYMGNKKRLIDSGLIGMFPKKIHTFVDLFSGSGIVSMNTRADMIIMNDIDVHLIELYELFKSHTAECIIQHIESRMIQSVLLKQKFKSQKVFSFSERSVIMARAFTWDMWDYDLEGMAYIIAKDQCPDIEDVPDFICKEDYLPLDCKQDMHPYEGWCKFQVRADWADGSDRNTGWYVIEEGKEPPKDSIGKKKCGWFPVWIVRKTF